CIEYESGNGNGNATICDVTKQQRISRCFNELISVFRHKIALHSLLSVLKNSWFCLPPTFCCELKCCDRSAPYYKILTGCSLLLLFAPLCLAMYRMTAADDVEEKKPNEGRMQETR
ncbi:hypothetical protein PENTCL1PPCAC_25773, partial [Pristionchus entomophagus]